MSSTVVAIGSDGSKPQAQIDDRMVEGRERVSNAASKGKKKFFKMGTFQLVTLPGLVSARAGERY